MKLRLAKKVLHKMWGACAYPAHTLMAARRRDRRAMRAAAAARYSIRMYAAAIPLGPAALAGRKLKSLRARVLARSHGEMRTPG